MWGLSQSTDFSQLGKPTTQFDSCGIQITDPSYTYSLGSSYPAWQDALSFLEWYQIPLMSTFGMIIVDDTNTQKYYKYYNLPKNYTVDCFNNAKILIGFSIFSIISLAYLTI